MVLQVSHTIPKKKTQQNKKVKKVTIKILFKDKEEDLP